MKNRIFNHHQPIRSLINPKTGSPLLHRTFPRLDMQMPSIMTTPYQLCQMRMYRHCVNGEFPNNAAAREMQKWLDVGRNVLGSTILQAVQYEARKMINNKKVPKPTVIYSFIDLLELQYGLEWQICTWLRTFLKERDAQEVVYSGPEAAEQELEIIATMPYHEYMLEYEEPLRMMRNKFRKRSWELDWKKLCVGLEETLPEKLEAIREPGAPPKSIMLIRKH